MRSRQARVVIVALVIALTAGHAQVAMATGQSLKRSVGNITQAPLDVALVPVAAALTSVRNSSKCKKLRWKPVCVAVGTGWHTLLGLGGAAGRGAGGVIELPLGLAFLFSSKDGPAVFDPSGVAALVDVPTDVYDIKFGMIHVED